MDKLLSSPVISTNEDQRIENFSFFANRNTPKNMQVLHKINTMFTAALMMYYVVDVLLLFCVRCPCMAINVSVRYDGGLLPDIILLTECYYHRGTRLNAMKRFCLCSL